MKKVRIEIDFVTTSTDDFEDFQDKILSICGEYGAEVTLN